MAYLYKLTEIRLQSIWYDHRPPGSAAAANGRAENQKMEMLMDTSTTTTKRLIIKGWAAINRYTGVRRRRSTSWKTKKFGDYSVQIVQGCDKDGQLTA